MTTSRQYWNALRTTRNSIAAFMGVDVNQCTKDVRAISNATLADVAIVVKCLVDKGLITDADLTAARNAALGPDGSVWDDEPVNPLPPVVL